jgi:RNA polymerase sigma-70 factor, ECF subfamily
VVLDQPSTSDAPEPGWSDKADAWWRDNADRVRAYLVHQTDRATAEDLLVEVFEIAMRRHEIVPEPPIGWLLNTARHVVANHRRGRKRYLGMVTRVAVQERARPTDDTLVGEHDARVELEALLAGTSAKDREVLTLAAWYDLTTEQAAEALGISAGAYRTRLSRARADLQKRHEARLRNGEEGR